MFVVATPCPLILAAPIALMSGLSRAARAGVVVKGAATIEQLGAARSVLFDKTGTITLGHPELDRVVSTNGLPAEETLRLAASLDQLSAHPLARALVAGAEEHELALAIPEDAEEVFGRGVRGTVDGHSVLVGSGGWLREHRIDPRIPEGLDGGDAKVLVGVDGTLAGVLLIGDRLRADSAELVPRLRAVGIRHVALVTGDKRGVAERVGATLGVDRVYAEQTPEEKLEVVRALHDRPDLRGVVMVGDGINDAPALALADVGIAMGSAGATVSSETADAVILVDRVDRVADAISIGRSVDVHRPPERPRRDRPLVAGDGRRRRRVPPARQRCAVPGGDRRRRHPQRSSCAPRLALGPACASSSGRAAAEQSKVAAVPPNFRRFMPILLVAALLLFVLPTILHKKSSGSSAGTRATKTTDAMGLVDRGERAYRTANGHFTSHVADLLSTQLAGDLSYGVVVQLDVGSDGQSFLAQVDSDVLSFVRGRRGDKLVADSCLVVKSGSGVGCPAAPKKTK